MWLKISLLNDDEEEVDFVMRTIDSRMLYNFMAGVALDVYLLTFRNKWLPAWVNETAGAVYDMIAFTEGNIGKRRR